MIELEQAIEILKKNAPEICEVEEKNLLDCVGKICAENYFAKLDNPPFNRSPLDGFTFNSATVSARLKKIRKNLKLSAKSAWEIFLQAKLKILNVCEL